MREIDNFFNFEHCIEMIRSKDALTFEAGYYSLAEKASIYVDELIALMKAEQEPFTRDKFVELIGVARSSRAFEALAEELNHYDHGVREWAINGLVKLGMPEADVLVRKYREKYPSEPA